MADVNKSATRISPAVVTVVTISRRMDIAVLIVMSAHLNHVIMVNSVSTHPAAMSVSKRIPEALPNAEEVLTDHNITHVWLLSSKEVSLYKPCWDLRVR